VTRHEVVNLGWMLYSVSSQDHGMEISRGMTSLGGLQQLESCEQDGELKDGDGSTIKNMRGCG